jgi:tetratricopeptide (TPR) repeat protein
VLTVAVVVALGPAGWSQPRAQPPAGVGQVPGIHELLSAYWRGEFDVVARRFTTGESVAAILPKARIWLASADARGWEFGSVVLFLELADAAMRLPDPAPDAAVQLVRDGFALLTDKRRNQAPRDVTPPLEERWHQAALGILQATGHWAAQQAYLRDLDRRFPSSASYRALASGIATEQRYASSQVGATAVRAANAAERALEDAIRQYDRAARDNRLRAEASARAAAAYLRLGRARDAQRRLDLVEGPGDELLVDAWVQFLRGTVVQQLDQQNDGAEYLARARQLVPGDDPWRELDRGEFRKVPGFLAELKGAVATSTSSHTTTSSRVPAAVVLDRYARGEFDVVRPALASAGSLAEFSKDFRASVRAWADEPDDADEQRRRRAVGGAIALEAAQARGVVERGEAQLLVEFICSWLRAQPERDPFEPLWHRAAAALMQGVAAGVALEVHVTHALRAWPDDPALVLARAVAAELRAGADTRTRDRTVPADPEALALAESRFTQAATFEVNRHDAQLRLGSIALRQGKPHVALTRLDAAGATSDPWAAYMVHLLTGRAHAARDSWQDAAASYRQARAIVDSQTASAALVAALSAAGDYAGAAAEADRLLQRSTPVADPWLSYGQGDFRHWAALMARIRESTRR